MTEERRRRAELLAALHASGAASEQDERDLADLIAQDPSLERTLGEFRDSIVALASSVDPIETSPETLARIQSQIRGARGGWWARFRRWLRKP